MCPVYKSPSTVTTCIIYGEVLVATFAVNITIGDVSKVRCINIHVTISTTTVHCMVQDTSRHYVLCEKVLDIQEKSKSWFLGQVDKQLPDKQTIIRTRPTLCVPHVWKLLHQHLLL